MQPPSTRSFVALWAVLLQVGCVQHHGDFALLASPGVYEQISDTATASHRRSSGRACFSLFRALFSLPDSAIPRATAAALAPFPEANALLLVEIQDEGVCVVVSGVPGRIEPGSK